MALNNYEGKKLNFWEIIKHYWGVFNKYKIQNNYFNVKFGILVEIILKFWHENVKHAYLV